MAAAAAAAAQEDDEEGKDYDEEDEDEKGGDDDSIDYAHDDDNSGEHIEFKSCSRDSCDSGWKSSRDGSTTGTNTERRPCTWLLGR